MLPGITVHDAGLYDVQYGVLPSAFQTLEEWVQIWTD